jgi:hypothetical protein
MDGVDPERPLPGNLGGEADRLELTDLDVTLL